MHTESTANHYQLHSFSPFIPPTPLQQQQQQQQQHDAPPPQQQQLRRGGDRIPRVSGERDVPIPGDARAGGWQIDFHSKSLVIYC